MLRLLNPTFLQYSWQLSQDFSLLPVSQSVVHLELLCRRSCQGLGQKWICPQKASDAAFAFQPSRLRWPWHCLSLATPKLPMCCPPAPQPHTGKRQKVVVKCQDYLNLEPLWDCHGENSSHCWCHSFHVVTWLLVCNLLPRMRCLSNKLRLQAWKNIDWLLWLLIGREKRQKNKQE